MAFNTGIPPILGLIPVIAIFISGFFSIAALIKYKDYSFLLSLSILIWIFETIMLIGEFTAPH